MGHDFYSDAMIRSVLADVKSVAMVGASANQARPSYAVLRYLIQHGYRVYPVNPGLAGQAILGAPVYAALSEVPDPIDMVDIFRVSEAAGAVVDEALRLAPKTEGDLDATDRPQRRRCGSGRGTGAHGDHEPLSQDRVRPPVGGDRLERHQLANHQRQGPETGRVRGAEAAVGAMTDLYLH